MRYSRGVIAAFKRRLLIKRPAKYSYAFHYKALLIPFWRTLPTNTILLTSYYVSFHTFRIIGTFANNSFAEILHSHRLSSLWYFIYNYYRVCILLEENNIMVCKTYPILWFVTLSAFKNNIRFVLVRYVYIRRMCRMCRMLYRCNHYHCYSSCSMSQVLLTQ